MPENLQETHVLLGQRAEDRRAVPGQSAAEMSWVGQGTSRENRGQREAGQMVGELVGHLVVLQVM